MIAVDSSALVAVAMREPESELFEAFLSSREVRVGAPTLLETHMVLSRLGGSRPTLDLLSGLVGELAIQVTPFDRAMYDIAAAAFDRFGKGRHPAGLNFGDCLAYAVAKAHDLPLLFKGDDFRRTDIRPAL